MRYIAGRDNVVDDTFSRISQVNLLNLNDFSGLIEDQFSDPELQSLMGSGTSLELRPMYFASSEKSLYCDVSTGTVRPCGADSNHCVPPQCNGTVERFHRHLKSALMAHLPENWLDALPLVLLGIRSSFKPDLATSSTELVYGTTLKLPGEFFSNTPVTTSTSSFLQMLRHHVRLFRPVPTKNRCSSAVFVSDDLIKASRVFLRIYWVRKSLEPPYACPYKVLSRTEKVFTVKIDGKPTTVSIDRLKAAHLFLDDFPSWSSPPVSACKAQRSEVVSRSGRRSRRVVHFQASPFA
ncbi:hypothetical protein AVEN_41888-1 [Araneus ventricosus]|uniref:Integrase catalytic domain-containing protein n=1 Tax=Araneus ventricosus TaxID=182803 RepID=A0A4Y2ACL4_ARAVE|nr:hypothetical protein AVEN_41888-1 [Araneus ventricosus]